MISQIEIIDTATYKDRIEINPTEINYIYGCNGSGKTTLSNLIRNPQNYENCSLKWLGDKLETIVYNRDFVKENFSQSSAIRGIFTLGKDTKEAKECIENLKSDIDKLNNKIESYDKTLQSKIDEKKKKTDEIIEKCWRIKQKYEEIFKPAFKGFIGKKKSFFEKCIKEENNSSKLLERDVLYKKCNNIYNNPLVKYDEVNKPKYDRVSELENDDILKEKIIGKEDIQIGELIKRINNSDWVKQGVAFLNKSNSVCPFCQQPINDEFKKNIEEFFDETYRIKCEALKKFKEEYDQCTQNLINQIDEIITNKIEIINYESLINELELIRHKKSSNMLLIDEKLKSPSIIIELDKFSDNFNKIELILETYIDMIKENNRLVDNINNEKEQLCSEIWRYIYNELEEDIKEYVNYIKGVGKAEENINISKKNGQDEIIKLQKQIDLRQSEITSIIHTVNEINRILKLFGFNNFKLAEADERGYYKIIRLNGEDVNQTLSEGEYTFITFLYFYQLVKGSIEKTGVMNDKVVVIDDPISSLDSNVLFIVSNLVKNITRSCNDGKNGIKQVFILTHNVYFHKEIIFKGSQESNTNKESFWIIRKIDGVSRISRYFSNPIQTTYELLWRELEDPQRINIATVFNTMRRILEYYFNILGGQKYEKCIDNFEGEEKLICKSLISWINDGSHFIGDDLEVPIEQDEIQKYLNVFKLIFEKMGQIDHYNMMMKIKE